MHGDDADLLCVKLIDMCWEASVTVGVIDITLRLRPRHKCLISLDTPRVQSQATIVGVEIEGRERVNPVAAYKPPNKI